VVSKPVFVSSSLHPHPTLRVLGGIASAVLLIAFSVLFAPAESQSPGSQFARLVARADTARDAGRLDEATSLYRKALALQPAWPEGWWSLGTILYDQNSYPAAARAFARLVSYDPKNGTARLMLALCQYQLNLDDRAMQNIQAAKKLGIKKDEQLQHVLQYHEGMLLLRKGRYEEALEALQLLVKQGVHSNDLDAALGMGALLLRPKDEPSEGTSGRQVLLRAGQAEASGILKKYDEGKRSYADLVQEFPTYPNIHYAYGRFLLAFDELDEAIVQFQQEIKNYPTHIRARMRIAAANYRINSAAGIPYASEVVKLQPRYPFGHYLLGLLYLDSGDIQLSIPELEVAVHMVPREAQFQFALGSAYSKAGRKADAARARAAFLRLNGNNQSTGGQTPAGKQPLHLDMPR
jgi:tetratricopeptide (TPR) repeat protein